MALSQHGAAWLVMFTGLVFCHAGWGEESVPVGYRAIAAEGGIPSTVLYAMALTESGKQVTSADIYRPWPWTLNVAGRGYFFSSRLEAWQALIDELQKGQRSIDIGLMQVSWRYHQKRLGTPWQALDPYFNLRVGSAILQTCYQSRQDWWASVGCYHAPTNLNRADRYRLRVLAHWRWITSVG